MASKYMCIIAIMFFAVSKCSLGTEYVVGDNAGWTIGYEYQGWTGGKDFKVGDTLVFRYPVGVYNVFQVNGTSFTDCLIPPPSEALVSGKDVISLSTLGNKYFICGVLHHCILGQKVFIDVMSEEFPVLAPAPSRSRVGEEECGYKLCG